MDTSEIVKRAIDGSKDDFVSLIRHSEGIMYGVARGIVNTDNDASDAIQETILKAYRNLNQLREPAHFRTWLIRILINECRTILRQNRRFAATVNHLAHHAEQDVASLEDRIELDELLKELDLDHREIIALYYIQDIPVKEIALILDISEGTVKSRLYRARAKLSAMMGANRMNSTEPESLSKEALQ